MTKREQIIKILEKINMKNINQGIDIFNNAVQDFGKSMDKITRELYIDIENSYIESDDREKKNKENIAKIWGKKD